MEGDELRRRLDRLGRPYTELAPLLGLSIDGLHHQMRGNRRVSRQTQMLLKVLERGCRVEPAQLSRRSRNLKAPSLFVLVVFAALPTIAAPPPEAPYSCRLLYDEQKKCSFDPHCAKRVIERLTRECLREGGRPSEVQG